MQQKITKEEKIKQIRFNKQNKRKVRDFVKTTIYFNGVHGNVNLNKRLPGLAVDIWIRLNSLTPEQIKERTIPIPTDVYAQYVSALNSITKGDVEKRPDLSFQIYNNKYYITDSKSVTETLIEANNKIKNERSEKESKGGNTSSSDTDERITGELGGVEIKQE